MKTNGKQTNDRILQAAHQLIARRGYSNFSYADVSGAIAIHKASIHHHFPTKAALALAVTRQAQEIFKADMAKVADDGADPLGQLQAYLGYWERTLVEDPEMYCVAGMLGAEVPFLEDDVARAVGEYFADITGWLENLLAAGRAAAQFQLGGTVQEAAAELVSLVYGAVLVARASGNPAHFRLATRAAVARLTHASA
jgi:TetR/AcrR family transcriptional repressor of nem operon